MADVKEALISKKRKQADKELLSAINYGLEEAVGHAGGVLSGLSVKFGETDCLMTVKAKIGDNPMVAFVGAPSLRDCFRKAEQLAWCDELRWRADKFRNGSG